MAGYKAAVEITYPFFSSPITAETFTTIRQESLETKCSTTAFVQKSAIHEGDRPFEKRKAIGGLEIKPAKCALLFIEFQNEFTSVNGKIYESVKENIETSGMLLQAPCLSKQLRKTGVKVLHAPITFEPDGSDNPNKRLGTLAGCHMDKLFLKGKANL